MNTTKILALAALASLSLGVGAAMAQEGGLSVGWGYQMPKAAVTAQAASTNQPQAGSSDLMKLNPYSIPGKPDVVENESLGGGG